MMSGRTFSNLNGGRLRVASNFDVIPAKYTRARAKMDSREETRYEGRRRKLRDLSPHGSPFSGARVYFAGIAKIGDYSQSRRLMVWIGCCISLSVMI